MAPPLQPRKNLDRVRRMCGLFGYVGPFTLVEPEMEFLKNFSVRRGQDSSGIVFHEGSSLRVFRGDFSIKKLWNSVVWANPRFLAGHSRLITNGHDDNQPVVRDGVITLHNGIILNSAKLWAQIGKVPKLEIDTEIIPALIAHFLAKGFSLRRAAESTLDAVEGEANCILIDSHSGEVAVMSNNGSLYIGDLKGGIAISSEFFPLQKVGSKNIKQIIGVNLIGSLECRGDIEESDLRRARTNLVPKPASPLRTEMVPDIISRNLRRCSRCILTETMPFISFDEHGVCNYCRSYKPHKSLGGLEVLFEEIVSKSGPEGRVLFPFSGGRDSSFGLHIATKTLGLKPIAYTYDWGMITDLGRRNQSLMCAKLGVEHIVVSANIAKKRENIRRNVAAWLRNPHLGMVNLFTAGDKHFFQHVPDIQRQTGVEANLWSFNPLETTHFKTGFLGIPPDFESTKVYKTGLAPQIRYQSLRGLEFIRNPAYLNRSIWDTLSGEYFRSVQKKTSFFQLFDYTAWNEGEVEKTLDDYGWERATDTSTSWRIGDGTAAFYNYIFYSLAGFTEHDTLRSNQVREGHISRSTALDLVSAENQPRYASIRWYLEAIGLNFSEVMLRINEVSSNLPAVKTY